MFTYQDRCWFYRDFPFQTEKFACVYIIDYMFVLGDCAVISDAREDEASQ